MTPRRFPTTGALALALLVSGLPAIADTSFEYYVYVAGITDAGKSAPRAVGPIPVTGGVGSSGTGDATCDKGRMRALSTCMNPVSGLFTPQIDVHTIQRIDLYDISCPGLPPGVPEPFNLILHTRLTGEIAISGAHPYGSTLEIGVFSGSDFLFGRLSLDGSGSVSEGLLAGVPLVTDEYALDIPLVLYLAEDPQDFLTLQMQTRTGGTALGTEVNTATANFNGHGWELNHPGPVFSGLPEGVTINIPSLNVVNNQWVGPTVSVGDRPLPAALEFSARTNPMRGIGRFSLSMPEAGRAMVEVFDLRGARVATLLDSWQSAGSRELEWNTSGMPPGVFFARAALGRHVATRRVVVVP